MSLAGLAIKRPIFITCVIILMLAVGLISMQRLPVDQFPDVTFPVVNVTIPYPGAGPEEVENLVTKPVEEQLGTLQGLKRLRSQSFEGNSRVTAEFTLGVDIKDAEQRVRDRVAEVRRQLPDDIKEPTIRRIDPSDQPVAIVSLVGNLSPAKLYDLAEDGVKPKFEQVPQVGFVEILGGRKREIRVDLDINKLKAYEVSASQVAGRIGLNGQNIPAGRVDLGERQQVIRTLAEFRSLDDIRSTVVNFVGNDNPVTIADLGTVSDSLQEEVSRTLVNGQPAVSLWIFKQSRANTVQVVEGIKKRLAVLNADLEKRGDGLRLELVRDGSNYIRANLFDVKETIIIGIGLTFVVVFLFLGNLRSTFITGLALPNSLIGAFILMAWAGFTINVMSLLALSLAVGLLIDDAIVVRENIFRHLELGEKPRDAALRGTSEVTLAVIATTMVVIAVFGPIAFLDGVVGQFFREFGLTVCFAMLISLFDALTIAPMLSTYMAGDPHARPSNFVSRGLAALAKTFDRMQSRLEHHYGHAIDFTLKRPGLVVLGAVLIFFSSIYSLRFINSTFLPAQDMGEFSVSIELPPGANLGATAKVAMEVDALIRKNKEVTQVVQSIGNRSGDTNMATYFVYLVPRKERTQNTSQFKDLLREQLKPYAFANPQVKDIDGVGGGIRPFNLNITGQNLPEVEAFAKKVFERLKDHPALKDPDISSRPGKPEFQAAVDKQRAVELGVSTKVIGEELRTLVEGAIPAVFRENGKEYDIRVRLQEDQRNLEAMYKKVHVPNLNNSLVRLESVAKPVSTVGPVSILRQDRGRYVQIAADIAPKGPGLGGVMKDIDQMFKTDLKLPDGMGYSFVGQAEDFKDLQQNMLMAVSLGVLFIFLVLASLYESFITPLAIMTVLPLAACGAFFALLITRQSLDIFSMIGLVMLLGVASKNSILIVDLANQLLEQGLERTAAIRQACVTRLRPILMTSFALIAGMLPVAIGLNEASKQRTSMGVSIIGGIISSTLLSLVVVPACFYFIDRFKTWMKGRFTSGRSPQGGGGKSRKEVRGEANAEIGAARVVSDGLPVSS